ncbi:MAG: hypothetical protein U1F43_37180 [Myxococcota bacterium]
MVLSVWGFGRRVACGRQALSLSSWPKIWPSIVDGTSAVGALGREHAAELA